MKRSSHRALETQPGRSGSARRRRRFLLRGKTVLVTGAARRLGAALATACAARGGRLALHYHRSASAAGALAAKLRRGGARAEAFQADLSRPEECEALIAALLKRFGAVDVLVHSAARFVRQPFAALTLADWNAHLDLNLRAGFLLAHGLAPAMLRRGGKMLFLADIAAERPWRDYLPYSVSKAGVVALTKALAKELAPRIQVNAIAPGAVLPPARPDSQATRRLVRRIPLGRLGSAADVVGIALLLLEGTDYMTGSVVAVDGGRSLY